MEPGRKLLDGLGAAQRGKLSEFNRLLRGDHGTTYMVHQLRIPRREPAPGS